MKTRLIILALSLLSCLRLSAQTLPLVDIGQQPACVHSDRDSLHFPGSRATLDSVYVRLDSLLRGCGQSLNIWHVGGSHVQAGHLPYRIMTDLATVAGAPKGTRGFLFPYSLAKTNFDKSYAISGSGNWTAALSTKSSKEISPRYGITGLAAYSEDPEASVGFNLNINSDTCWQFSRLRVLGYGSSEKVFPYVIEDADTLRCSVDSLTRSYVFDLGKVMDTVEVRFNIPEGESFTLTGLEPINPAPGINYYCSGVNGAMLRTWLDKCTYLPQELQIVKPQLAIFAVGINDSACKAVDFKYERFKSNYRRLIALVRDVNPDCAIIFITNNDSYRWIGRSMTYNNNGATVQKAMYELAEECGGAVWDLYDIMGGKDSVTKWRDAGLAKKDRLHFTKEGYTLLGDLFYNALASDFNRTRQ